MSDESCDQSIGRDIPKRLPLEYVSYRQQRRQHFRIAVGVRTGQSQQVKRIQAVASVRYEVKRVQYEPADPFRDVGGLSPDTARP